jgi:hypothetical protein
MITGSGNTGKAGDFTLNTNQLKIQDSSLIATDTTTFAKGQINPRKINGFGPVT